MQSAARIAETKPHLFRWHVAGDILSTDYLHGMCRIADANPPFERSLCGRRFRVLGVSSVPVKG
jgi:hypothetical protein